VLSRLQAVAFDAHDPARLVQFWANVLGREIAQDARGALLAGEDAQLGLRFVRSSAQPVRPNRMHLHLTSTSADDQQQTVATAL
jgi:catechol-2,3-dioxygenase